MAIITQRRSAFILRTVGFAGIRREIDVSCLAAPQEHQGRDRWPDSWPDAVALSLGGETGLVDALLLLGPVFVLAFGPAQQFVIDEVEPEAVLGP